MSAITHRLTSRPSYCISTWLCMLCSSGENRKAQCSLDSSCWAAFQFNTYELRCMFLPREPTRACCSMWFALRRVWRPHLPTCHLGRASRSELFQLREAPLPRGGLLLQLGIGWITTPRVHRYVTPAELMELIYGLKVESGKITV